MKRKLNCILLIDDDSATNYINQIMIEGIGCAENIVAMESGEDALSYLQTIEGNKYPQPDLIFLDINMPAMSGWEFIEDYKALPAAQKGKIIVVMLTTSINPEDAEKAKDIPELADFVRKPLTSECLIEILKANFADYF